VQYFLYKWNGLPSELFCSFLRLAHDRWWIAVIRKPRTVFGEIREIVTLRLYGCGDSCRRIHALCTNLHGFEAAIERLANDHDVSISEICEKTNVLYSERFVACLRTFACTF
jgi:hypothetical protein